MFEWLLLGELRELFQKGNILDLPVTNTQRTFAGGAFQLRIFSRPVKVAESAAVQTPFPFRWQPRANWDRIEVRFEIDALIIPDAGVCLGVNAFVAARIRCKIDIVNREQRLGDEKMRAAEIKIGKQCHLHSPASGDILKIRTVRRNEQPRTEKAGLLATKLPCHVGLLRFNPLHVNSAW